MVPPPAAVEAAAYLPFESDQLTPAIIANLTDYRLSDVELFNFQDASDPAAQRRSGQRSCKAFPGEQDWPHDSLWWLLDLLTGLALIDGVPPASVCYPDWPQYDEAKCESITSKWTTPQYQYVVVPFHPFHVNRQRLTQPPEPRSR